MTEPPLTTPTPMPEAVPATPSGPRRHWFDALRRRVLGHSADPARPRWVRFEQAVYGSFAFRDQGYALLAQSPRCRPEWLADFRAACQKIGERPAGVGEFPGLFALPLRSGVWAIVGISPQGRDDQGRPGALAFHALFVSRRDYRKTGHDPFVLAPALRSDWDASTTSLASGTWRLGASPTPLETSVDPRVPRIVAALTRGRRVVLEAAGPADDLARQVWRALPERVRRRASVATWTFGNANRFDLAALPRLAGVPLDASYLDPTETATATATETGLALAPARPDRARWLPASPRVLAALGAAVILAGAGVVLAVRGVVDDQDDAPAGPAPLPVASAPIEPTRAPSPARSPRLVRRADPEGPDPVDFPAERNDDDPAERRRVAEVLEDLADRCGVARPEGGGGTPEPAALMEALARALRYRGPWLSAADLEAIEDQEPTRSRELARTWNAMVRRFASDRPLPADFRAGGLRWQLAALAWSFHLDPSRGAVENQDEELPRRSVSEVAQGFAESIARDAAVTPDPIVDRYPALAAYAAFLARLPRR